MSSEETKQILFEIWRDCELGGYLLVEEQGEVRIVADPTVRQLPLTQEKHGCAEQFVRQRLERQLSE